MSGEVSFLPSSNERYLSITLALAQYPILSSRIRERMRQFLFTNGIIQHQVFESQVREAALRSQQREGMEQPYEEEPVEIWELRVQRMRDQLTDLRFSHFFKFETFEKIVNEVLEERGLQVDNLILSMNPELAPLETVFEQAMSLERMDLTQKQRYAHRLQELKVVLIRALISDQLRYINIAKEWFTIHDLSDIRRRRIGAGRIGGKSAGMLLANRVITDSLELPPDVTVDTPESYYIGSQELYTYMSINNLAHWNDQKYKTEEEMRADYPTIVDDFLKGDFPPDITARLEGVMASVGKRPVIVRSSSLLEDNFGTSFAGKYESVFLPNQASPAENMRALTQAIAQIYASTLNPNALLYRRSKGLLDYDERMAILIQVVQGEAYGRYYLPHAAGVAFSHNLFRWSPQLRKEDGFVRLVWGLGTRAVDRVGNDYPRLVALSHPLLRPSTKPSIIQHYSQQYVDLLDLEDNTFKTLPVHEMAKQDYRVLRYLFQTFEDGYFTTLRSNLLPSNNRNLVLTYDEFLRKTPFAEKMRQILQTLEQVYRAPVDMEFTAHLKQGDNSKPQLQITVLQCRPQSQLAATEQVPFPAGLKDDRVVFSTRFVVPQGYIEKVDYVVFVPPEGYFALPTLNLRIELARAIGKLNAALAGKPFICIGPGRWGSSNSDLGVPISYGDIYHTKSLVELAGPGIGPEPEPSLGTHFFQDLLESQIYPLAIELDNSSSTFNHAFFYESPNRVNDLIDLDQSLKDALHLIRVTDYAPDHHICIIMNEDKGQALAYLEPESPF